MNLELEPRTKLYHTISPQSSPNFQKPPDDAFPPPYLCGKNNMSKTNIIAGIALITVAYVVIYRKYLFE